MKVSTAWFIQNSRANSQTYFVSKFLASRLARPLQNVCGWMKVNFAILRVIGVELWNFSFVCICKLPAGRPASFWMNCHSDRKETWKKKSNPTVVSHNFDLYRYGHTPPYVYHRLKSIEIIFFFCSLSFPFQTQNKCVIAERICDIYGMFSWHFSFNQSHTTNLKFNLIWFYRWPI